MARLSTEDRRKFRVRNAVKSSGRLRLSVHRSLQHIYAQIIDDSKGVTLAAVSSKSLKLSGNKTEVAKKVGAAIAEAAKAKGIAQVVFDRGAFKYHGRVKALADAAREGGLEF
ncbi:MULTISPECIES: 50S ribosomal protein L18 [Meiothermus]|uniref:Large ribosomal subunit protein uL18 n=2 Tax=Meiothermus hypogaeus TaxID=884155 RepID=A0A511R2J7_9DEIN|nr:MULTISPECIES: 50S ribosomal protein L18 [Meiothermus]RIH78268.1 50S ribosomal protein L18 [Meiothermus hypogaeus]GEM83838.1 50S ribosomal protein L18 [Meiothermus hypogaeus NBRC 106114]GIW34426.1 MAG: 50S ribosomal protein L18 [Meiothermus sp.]